MAKVSDVYGGFFKREDFQESARVLTIKSTREGSFEGDQGGEKTKIILAFLEDGRELVLNKTNADTMVALYGDESDHWVGKKIEVFFNPMIPFRGKRVGGLNVRGAV